MTLCKSGVSAEIVQRDSLLQAHSQLYNLRNRYFNFIYHTSVLIKSATKQPSIQPDRLEFGTAVRHLSVLRRLLLARNAHKALLRFEMEIILVCLVKTGVKIASFSLSQRCSWGMLSSGM